VIDSCEFSIAGVDQTLSQGDLLTLENCAEFSISDCEFTDAYASGIELMNSGTSPRGDHFISGTTITGSGSTTSTAAAATGTVNANVGVTTHTGLTTASAASQVFTITNSICTAGSAILVSASNLGANDAQMTVTRVTPGAGSFTVTLTNNGAAALNGDVIITFFIIAA
jgi:hypothetical protein